MYKILGTVAGIAGVVGVVLCLAAGLFRVLGYYHVAGFEALTLFQGGIGLMVFACLLKLQMISGQLASR